MGMNTHVFSWYKVIFFFGDEMISRQVMLLPNSHIYNVLQVSPSSGIGIALCYLCIALC